MIIIMHLQIWRTGFTSSSCCCCCPQLLSTTQQYDQPYDCSEASIDVPDNDLDCSQIPIQDTDDTTTLLPASRKDNVFFRHKKKFGLALAFLIILIGLSLASTFLIYFHGRTKLHVFEFNVWGMPGGIGGCKYKKEFSLDYTDIDIGLKKKRKKKC